MYINHKVVVVLLFFLAVCICAGSFFEVSMTGAGKEHLEEMLSGLLNPENSGSAIPLLLHLLPVSSEFF